VEAVSSLFLQGVSHDICLPGITGTTLYPMEPNVSDNSCLGLESIRVCRLHEECPSIARKAPFQAKNQMSG
jgi:hypothetical protein